ncbi:type A2 lantipeptide [Streptacidiphilus sp. EB129]|jgi:hypothetical protein|uniref:type A2 lantipeptide n=1 Tax=Streptacidiphilus sp. EB129 TaxID=3156262 RepID=UPI0035110655
MRKDFTPQVETREISDSDLDNVSGGVGLLGLDVSGVTTPVLGAAESVLPISISQTVSQVTSLVPGQVTGLAGL